MLKTRKKRNKLRWKERDRIASGRWRDIALFLLFVSSIQPITSCRPDKPESADSREKKMRSDPVLLSEADTCSPAFQNRPYSIILSGDREGDYWLMTECKVDIPGKMEVRDSL